MRQRLHNIAHLSFQSSPEWGPWDKATYILGHSHCPTPTCDEQGWPLSPVHNTISIQL